MDYVDNIFPYTDPFTGNVTFTGPDGLRNYRPHLVAVEDTLPVGIGNLSEQESTSVAYLFRAAPGTPFARPRSCRPGEIGWGMPDLMDGDRPLTGQQIVVGEMRQLAEDRTTHHLLGAWYPSPEEDTPLGSDGFYRENIYSGRPGTANVRYMSPNSGGDNNRSPPSASREGRRPPSSPSKHRQGQQQQQPPSSSRRTAAYSPHRPPSSSVRVTNNQGDGVWTNE